MSVELVSVDGSRQDVVKGGTDVIVDVKSTRAEGGQWGALGITQQGAYT